MNPTAPIPFICPCCKLGFSTKELFRAHLEAMRDLIAMALLQEPEQ